jgi:hypothetical protein
MKVKGYMYPQMKKPVGILYNVASWIIYEWGTCTGAIRRL